MNKSDQYDHLYLYAKDWYKTSSDPIADLKKIVDHRAGGHDIASRDDVINVLTRAAVKEVLSTSVRGQSEFALVALVIDTDAHGIVEACLNVLNLAKVDGIAKPDPAVLPLAEGKGVAMVITINAPILFALIALAMLAAFIFGKTRGYAAAKQTWSKVYAELRGDYERDIALERGIVKIYADSLKRNAEIDAKFIVALRRIATNGESKSE